MQFNFYTALASALTAKAEAQKHGFYDLRDEWNDYLSYMLTSFLPRHHEFNAGTRLLEKRCTERMMAFITSYYHGAQKTLDRSWTSHNVFVHSTFTGLHIHVTGRDLNGAKGVIAYTFKELEDLRVPDIAEYRLTIGGTHVQTSRG